MSTPQKKENLKLILQLFQKVAEKVRERGGTDKMPRPFQKGLRDILETMKNRGISINIPTYVYDTLNMTENALSTHTLKTNMQSKRVPTRLGTGSTISSLTNLASYSTVSTETGRSSGNGADRSLSSASAPTPAPQVATASGRIGAGTNAIKGASGRNGAGIQSIQIFPEEWYAVTIRMKDRERFSFYVESFVDTTNASPIKLIKAITTTRGGKKVRIFFYNNTSVPANRRNNLRSIIPDITQEDAIVGVDFARDFQIIPKPPASAVTQSSHSNMGYMYKNYPETGIVNIGNTCYRAVMLHFLKSILVDMDDQKYAFQSPSGDSMRDFMINLIRSQGKTVPLRPSPEEIQCHIRVGEQVSSLSYYEYLMDVPIRGGEGRVPINYPLPNVFTPAFKDLFSQKIDEHITSYYANMSEILNNTLTSPLKNNIVVSIFENPVNTHLFFDAAQLFAISDRYHLTDHRDGSIKEYRITDIICRRPGHYVNYSLRRKNQNREEYQWYLYNDSIMEEKTEDQVGKELVGNDLTGRNGLPGYYPFKKQHNGYLVEMILLKRINMVPDQAIDTPSNAPVSTETTPGNRRSLPQPPPPRVPNSSTLPPPPPLKQ
jgi:hypothetical protein